VILATTRFLSDYVQEASSRIGVDYMIMKPCNIKAVTARLADMVHFRKPPEVIRPDPQVSVSNLLLVLGIGSNKKGYHYLRTAIPLYAKDPDQSMTKELYPAVAKLCQSDSKRVERSMRDAIEKAWENRDEQIWKLYFPCSNTGSVRKPTNSVFISRLADCLFREQTADSAPPER
jgi:two-component system response regulator (stage 0 sporulation protein A)